MDPEKGAITVVRFSPCTGFLASGSENGVVCVWKQEGDDWKLFKELKGAEKDVQDLAWAPDSSVIVAVGLDGTVVVWSGSTFELLKKVEAHKSHVKGVTFDPANMYFATASDDKTIKIVKCSQDATESNFSIEATISSPFVTSPLSTYYRRCSWSPDGNHIAAANAANGPVSTVTIINRDTWDSEISLVGHDSPCEVASFCPRIFSLDKPTIGSKNPGAKIITVIATAGQDKTLALWNTLNSRPMLVAHNVAEKSITDITWAPDGSRLYACSLDGTIIAAIFEEGELGWVVPLEENVSMLTKHGLKEIKPVEVTASDGSQKHDERNQMDAILGLESSATLDNSDKNLEPHSKVVKEHSETKTKSNGKTQKTTITKDGRKRIAPTLLTTSDSSIEPRTLARAIEDPPTSKEDVIEMADPSKGLPPGGVSALVIRPKRRASSEDQASGLGDSKRFRYDNEPHYIRPALLSHSSDLSRIRLSVPKVRTYIKASHDKYNHVLEIRNSSSQEMEPTTITITSKGDVIFRDFLPKYGHLATGNGSTFWAASTEDGTLYLYSPSGRRLVPGIILGCPLSFLECHDRYLMAVTCTGLLHVWDIETLEAVHSSVSIAPLLDNEMNASEDGLVKGPSITQCGVTSKGKAIITLSNGDGFIYSSQMMTWLRISEAWWAFGSQYWGPPHIDKARAHSDTSKDDASATGVISLIEHRTNQETMIKAGGRAKYLQRMARNRRLKEGYENFERCTSTAHLENRVSAAIMAESGEELASFLKMYAVRLAAEGMGKRLEELCNELLGPTVRIPNQQTPQQELSNKWSQTVCGIDKHELLKDIVLAVGKYREIQSVVVKYAHIVGVLDRINAM